MSTIAGVVYLDGRPCDPAVPQALAEALRHRSPDGTSVWIRGCAALVHGRLLATPEASHEHQPFVDASAGLAITFDGRLDNRDDLLLALDAQHTGAPPAGDAELTLRAYLAFGPACVDRLLGEFAFAIWDAPRRRLFGARDAMGLKPFCYRSGPGFLAWASEAGVLARHAGPMPPPNEGMVGEHLMGIVTSRHETLYRDIYRLPPAHVLTADADGVRLRRYWQPDLCAELRYRRDEDYAEHLTELLRTAVAACLRAPGPVGISLSGGIDSSSITGIAAEMVAGGAVPATGIEAFFLQSPGGADDGPFFDQVVARWALPAHRVLAKALRPGQLKDEAAHYGDIPNSPNAATADRLRALVRQTGARVVLTGDGADEWFLASDWAFADLLRRGRLGSLAARLRFASASEDFRGWAAAAKSTVWPLVPKRARRWIRRAVGSGRPHAWIDPAFAVRIDLADRLAQHELTLPFRSYEQYDTWHESTGGAAVHARELFERSAARVGIEQRYPFFDRRIVEFGLAVPPDQRWRNGRGKDLLRRAMAPYVPAEVTRRTSSPHSTHLLVDGIGTEGGPALLANTATARLGWVVENELSALFDRMTALFQAGDDQFAPLAVSLWYVTAVELWARAVDCGIMLKSTFRGLDA